MTESSSAGLSQPPNDFFPHPLGAAVLRGIEKGGPVCEYDCLFDVFGQKLSWRARSEVSSALSDWPVSIMLLINKGQAKVSLIFLFLPVLGVSGAVKVHYVAVSEACVCPFGFP